MASDDGSRPSEWRLWIDTGGTFTDCLGVDPEGRIRRAKVLSSGRVRGSVAHVGPGRSIRLQVDWDLPPAFFRGAFARPLGDSGPGTRVVDYLDVDRTLAIEASTAVPFSPGEPCEILTGLEAPILAAHWVTRTPLSEGLPPLQMRLATTRGTNALLERKGSPPVLFITRGFGDLLAIGTQQRRDLFSLWVDRPAPLYNRVIEVDERLDSNGKVLIELDLEAVREAATEAVVSGADVAAVALLHSYRNPTHENALAEFLCRIGFAHVSSSAALAPLIKLLPRAETAVVNAYLWQVIESYLAAIRRAIEPGPLHVLTSTGSLVGSRQYLPKDSLLSGPAGGVVGAAVAARESGFGRSLAFDMGGTSTDVSRWDGAAEYRFETVVGDVHLLSPSLAIETVAAGGGSICSFDGRQLKVGPESAGADPGPACYGAGGPLTLTDINLLLGRLDPESFEIPVEPEAAGRAAEELLAAVEEASGRRPQAEQLLAGALEIANERMAEAVRRISIRRGYRPSRYALVAFGGAGGQHACAIAEILGITTVLIPQDAGLLSALGLGRARIERFAARQVLRPLEAVRSEIEVWMAELADEATAQVLAEGAERRGIGIRQRLAQLRLQGQDAALSIEFEEVGALEESFMQAYQEHFGYLPAEPRVEVESLRVMAAAASPVLVEGEEVRGHQRAIPSSHHQVYLDADWRSVPVLRRESLVPGTGFDGPALVFERHCATLVAEDWDLEVDGHRCLVLRRRELAGVTASGAGQEGSG